MSFWNHPGSGKSDGLAQREGGLTIAAISFIIMFFNGCFAVGVIGIIIGLIAAITAHD